jgi:hypothetical protein
MWRSDCRGLRRTSMRVCRYRCGRGSAGADTVLIELELGLTFLEVDLDLIEQRRKQLATHLGAICGVDVLATRQSRGT